MFATLDAGVKTWLAISFMYDVKQFDPAEWTSPPLEARIVDKPGFGKVVVGRGVAARKRNIYLGMLAHVIINLIVGSITFGAIVRSHP